MNKKLKYLDFKEAQNRSLELVSSTQLVENSYIIDALGAILAEDIKCCKDLPSFNNSAMDGFAIKYSDAGTKLKIKRTIYAGDKGLKVEANLEDCECYKIMTGAIVPDDANTIVPIEDCEILDGEEYVLVPKEIKEGINLRYKGEEKKIGDILLKKGNSITPAIVALLASQGIAVVKTYKKLQILVLSTGNELKEPWENSSEYEIYNSNSYALIALLKQNGFNATYGGVVPDNLEQSKEFIKRAKKYDVIITTGGISLGDADFVAQAFKEEGLKPIFHGVNLKPGRPIMLGKMDTSVVVSLPGNPLTAFVNSYIFLIPVLRKFQGGDEFYYDVVLAKNQKEFKVKQGRVNVILGEYKNGEFCATMDNKYGAGMVSALCCSNALLITSENKNWIEANEEVKIVTFKSDFSNKKIDILN